MLGVDVNVVHRMLKNEVSDQHVLTAYAAFTDDVWRHHDLAAHLPDAISHRENLTDAGELGIYVHDLQAAWEQRGDAKPTYRLDPIQGGTKLTMLIGPVLGPPVVRQFTSWVLRRNYFPLFQE